MIFKQHRGRPSTPFTKAENINEGIARRQCEESVHFFSICKPPRSLSMTRGQCSLKIWGCIGFDWVVKLMSARQRAAKVSVKTLKIISANTDTYFDYALAA